MNSITFQKNDDGDFISWSHPFWTDGVSTDDYYPTLSVQDIQKLPYRYAERLSLIDYVKSTYGITEPSDVAFIVDTFIVRLSRVYNLD